MTGPGTNTYLVGDDTVAIVDPGPDDDAHLAAVLDAVPPSRIAWIVLTHTHPDHWPMTRRLLDRTDAVLAAAPRSPRADRFDIAVTRRLADGDRIVCDEWAIDVVHTPGHAPNHVCLLLEAQHTLFTGDHVLSGTTPVVSPQRGGDMAAYLASTRRLRSLAGLERILPAHGAVIDDPYACLDEYLEHRRMREEQILAAMGRDPVRIRTIVASVYPQLHTGLVAVARRQVHAHLVKLAREGVVDGRTLTGWWQRR
jgi:glyoxylase-like metal-dependent hydrolase (beta-lactamase superfamily II)